MPTYATQQDFEAYVEGWETEDPDALARLLERAEREVDDLLRLRFGDTVDPDTGLRLDPDELAALQPFERAALARAVCAQAEFRHTIGEQALRGRPVKRTTGPDFSIEYAEGASSGPSPIGPKVKAELRRGDLLPVWASVR